MPNQYKLWEQAIALLQNLATLILLAVALPFNLTLILISVLKHSLSFSQSHSFNRSATAPKKILLTGGKMTKALQLARSFHSAGHRVVLVETHKYWLTGHRFSRAVERFYTVPAPQHQPQAYVQALLEIVKQEQIDLVVPVSSPVSSWYDSLAKQALCRHCEVFHLDPDMTKQLDDKLSFNQLASSLGLSVPHTVQITDPQQILDFDFGAGDRQYILKSIAYDSVHRLDMTKFPGDRDKMAEHVRNLPIRPDNPWILQEFIAGQEYCTHSTVRDGVIQLHCCAKSSAFQVNYEQIDQPQILDWVTRFVGALQLTGQLSFDFIGRADGTVFAIECNPRTHSAITMFYNHPGVADAYLSKEPLANAPLQPLPDSKPTYWLYHELWRFTSVRSLRQLAERITILLRGTDAILRGDDPLPFLMVHHWQIPLLLLKSLRSQKRWVRIDFNIGKLVQLGGD